MRLPSEIESAAHARLGRFFRPHFRTLVAMSSPKLALLAFGLALGLVISFDLVSYAASGSTMRRAAAAGIHYYAQGGSDPAQARLLVAKSWTSPPFGHALAINSACKGASPHAASPCVEKQGGLRIVTIQLSGTVQGKLLSLSRTESQTIYMQCNGIEPCNWTATRRRLPGRTPFRSYMRTT